MTTYLRHVIVCHILVLTGTVADAQTFVGVTTTAETTGFRSTDVTKTFDTDDDGIYGTLGTTFFNKGRSDGGGLRTWNENMHDTSPAYLSLQNFSGNTVMTTGGTTLSAHSGGFSGADDIDDAALSGPAVANVNGAFGGYRTGSGVTVSAGDSLGLTTLLAYDVGANPEDIRIGIMAATLNDSRFQPDELGVRVGGNVASVSYLPSLAATTVDMLFFDVRGLQPGDLLEIVGAQSNFGITGPGGLFITGVTFDRALPIPEPATILIAALGVLGMAWLGWRRRKRA